MTHTAQDEHVFKIYKPELFGKMRTNKVQREKVGLRVDSTRTDGQKGVTYYYHDYQHHRSSEMSTHLSKYPTIPMHLPYASNISDPIDKVVLASVYFNFVQENMTTLVKTLDTVIQDNRMAETERTIIIELVKKISSTLGRMSPNNKQKNRDWLKRTVQLLQHIAPDIPFNHEAFGPLKRNLHLLLQVVNTSLDNIIQLYEYCMEAEKTIKRALSPELDNLSDSDLCLFENEDACVVEEHTKDPFVEGNMEQPSRPHVVSKPDPFKPLFDLDH